MSPPDALGMFMRCSTLFVGLATALAARAPRAAAQGTAAPKCTPICTPSVWLMPSVIRSHLFGGPRVRATATGATSRLPSTSNFEIIIAAASRTSLPRTSLFGSVQWLPNASEARNPFTLYTANELGGHVRANAPTVTLGLSFSALAPTETAGWLDAAVNVGDLYSQAARPDARSAYTHKLDLDLVTHLHVFDHLPAATYLHGVTAFAILDYVATGLPRAGDIVPAGREYLDNARPTSLIAGLSLPITAEAK